MDQVLVNPHVLLKQDEQVEGDLEYYHYGVGGLDDGGWGCAYRSFQTLCSWCEKQGYAPKNKDMEGRVPTHREIQMSLVKIGDQPQSIVGSHTWIGSVELAMCLDEVYDVPCKIVHFRSGREVPPQWTVFKDHFDQHGSPVMIGGDGMAKTMLGVRKMNNQASPEFLILDPHFRGPFRDLAAIEDGGWCEWTSTAEFESSGFYNFCFPQHYRRQKQN